MNASNPILVIHPLNHLAALSSHAQSASVETLAYWPIFPLASHLSIEACWLPLCLRRVAISALTCIGRGAEINGWNQIRGPRVVQGKYHGLATPDVYHSQQRFIALRDPDSASTRLANELDTMGREHDSDS